MALIKTPSAGTPFRFGEMMRGFTGIFSTDRKTIPQFEKLLSRFFGVKHVILTNSGTTSFFLILKVLKTLYPDRHEVVMPAYTAPSLILPIKEAGLSAKLVDMSPESFNMDLLKTKEAISDDVLAVMPVHMFGIPIDVKQIAEIAGKQGIPVIEDAASSMGSKVRGKYVGTTTEIGFFSFNRGKNLATLHGGFIQTNDDDLAEIIRAEAVSLPVNSVLGDTVTAVKIFALGLAVQPLGYSLLQPVVSKFKYTSLHTHFDSFAYPLPNAKLGQSLSRRFKSIFSKRVENGRLYLRGLGGVQNLRIPTISEDSEVVFNQFPVLIDQAEKREIIIESLLKNGIESTILYPYAVHEVFPEYADSPAKFPNALYFARHLLLLPVHPLMSCYKIQKAIEIVSKILS